MNFGVSGMSLVCKDLAIAASKCVQYVESLSIKVRLKENIYQNGSTSSSGEHIATIRNLIENIAKLAGGVSGQDDVGASDSVEGELANMDKVIEEAATRIEVSVFIYADCSIVYVSESAIVFYVFLLDF